MSTMQRNLFKAASMMTVSLRHFTDGVDNEEIERHNRFADKWWDEMSGPMRGLHAMNVLRIQFIRDGLIEVNKIKKAATNEYLQGIKILDVGCGGGILTIPLARLGADVVGLDASEELILVAKQYASKRLSKQVTRLEFLSTTIEEHSISNQESYDVVVMSEVLEHITSKEIFLACCLDVLKPCGSMFITTINKTYSAWLAAILLAENVLKLLPRGTHQWSKLVPLDELERYLKNSGCEVLHTNGMIYIPYKNIWLWTPFKSVNYAVHAIKMP